MILKTINSLLIDKSCKFCFNNNNNNNDDDDDDDNNNNN